MPAARNNASGKAGRDRYSAGVRGMAQSRGFPCAADHRLRRTLGQSPRGHRRPLRRRADHTRAPGRQTGRESSSGHGDQGKEGSSCPNAAKPECDDPPSPSSIRYQARSGYGAGLGEGQRSPGERPWARAGRSDRRVPRSSLAHRLTPAWMPAPGMTRRSRAPKDIPAAASTTSSPGSNARESSRPPQAKCGKAVSSGETVASKRCPSELPRGPVAPHILTVLWSAHLRAVDLYGVFRRGHVLDEFRRGR
jgi:hypothetical protein